MRRRRREGGLGCDGANAPERGRKRGRLRRCRGARPEGAAAAARRLARAGIPHGVVHEPHEEEDEHGQAEVRVCGGGRGSRARARTPRERTGARSAFPGRGGRSGASLVSGGGRGAARTSDDVHGRRGDLLRVAIVVHAAGVGRARRVLVVGHRRGRRRGADGGGSCWSIRGPRACSGRSTGRGLREL